MKKNIMKKLMAIALAATTLFPRAMRKIAMLAWIFDECREGCCVPVAHVQHRPKRSADQIPRPLGRCKIDTPLLAAGSLS